MQLLPAAPGDGAEFAGEGFGLVVERAEAAGAGVVQEDGDATGTGGPAEFVGAGGEPDGFPVRLAVELAGGFAGLGGDGVELGDDDVEGEGAGARTDDLAEDAQIAFTSRCTVTSPR